MTSDTPAAEQSSGFFGSLLSTIGNLGTKAAETYATVETAKLTEKANSTLKPSNPTQPITGTGTLPWYRQTWVIPTAIGAGLLLVVMVIFAGRRR